MANVIWVGASEMPIKEATCVERTRKVLDASGYSFQLWDNDMVMNLASNWPDAQDFLKIAFEQSKWAFIADCAKAMILVKTGGWVLDADNELLQPLLPFRRFHWVSGFENFKGMYLPITAVMGGVCGHKFSRRLLRVYSKSNVDAIFSMPNTSWISKILVDEGMNLRNERQYIEKLDVEIFPEDTFCGTNPTENTVSIHHFSGSWLPT